MENVEWQLRLAQQSRCKNWDTSVLLKRVQVLLRGFSDEAYKEAGVKVLKSAAALWKASDIVIKVRDPIKAEQKFFRDNQTLLFIFKPGR